MEIKDWLKDSTELGTDIWKGKYQNGNETLDEWFDRVSGGNQDIKQMIIDKKFLFAGRILANRGLNKEGRKVTYSNCYVIPKVEDSLESIFDTAKYLARTFSYGGGAGIDISKLRPNGSVVHNAAKTTSGAVSFMDLYSLTTELIGQKGRRAALMISMDISHPDIEEFIDIKTDLNKITKANISVKINNEFMKAVEENKKYMCRFTVENTGEVIEKEIDAKNDKWCIMNDVENKDDSWLEVRYNTITRHYSWFDKKVFCREDENDNKPTDIQYIFHITNSSIEVLGEYNIDMK